MDRCSERKTDHLDPHIDDSSTRFVDLGQIQFSCNTAIHIVSLCIKHAHKDKQLVTYWRRLAAGHGSPWHPEIRALLPDHTPCHNSPYKLWIYSTVAKQKI